MGGVRGDVIALGFIQTTIMEMGQPPSVESNADPAMWVRSRQYTGRVVTVTNAKIFDEPVYNYTRDFPYIWEEMDCRSPTRPTGRRPSGSCWRPPGGTPARTDETGAGRPSPAWPALRSAGDRPPPRVYSGSGPSAGADPTLHDRAHAERDVKDAISRDLLHAFDAAGIALTPEPVTP